MSLANQHIDTLIEHCKTGNQSAQLEVYNRFYNAMYNTSFRIVKNSFEAEDIMQDSFLTAFTKLETLKDIKTFSGWLKRIVVNNSIHHFNKNSKYEDVPFDAVMYKVEDTYVNTEQDEDASEQAKQVLKTMNTLKDNYRIALTLHLIEGYDYEETSSIMDVSYANCRTTISRAKESLRQKLQHVV
ncbi:RNA polymerase sigma factor [Formosa sp. PL04]|uniref:RNA polymerase sigma factor n=1 Tax=Formosa sp. PL04 TaxID=3081755 RepID=UPI00298175B3|nr:RNA polymerase sigma factor [Formosa sp. PL04]MDW5288629.1 RNA polymerase sigma factor [Formosa sp. PL04]